MTGEVKPGREAPAPALTIGKDVARRYLLGRLGLWPGRRWRGIEGVRAAIHALGSVQIDPLNVVGRNHDLVLWSRVLDYEPTMLEQLAYGERAFFDYGNLLKLYPIAELPAWRLHMRRRAANAHYRGLADQYAAQIEEVRAALRERGPLANRDFAGSARVESYRARKDTGLALHYLWTVGELMTHGRRGNFERLFGNASEIAPPEGLVALDDDAAEAHFARAALLDLGLGTAGMWSGWLAYLIQRRLSSSEAAGWLGQLEADGVAASVAIEGVRGPYYLPAADLPLLEMVAAGRIPDAWTPLETTTDEEVTLIGPLDPAIHHGYSGRKRARTLLDFEYLWEVYVPAAKRRWGYYTLPVLYGDRLVARLDPKLDRATSTLRVLGFWPEPDAPVDDPAFKQALTRGLARLAETCGVEKVEMAAVAG